MSLVHLHLLLNHVPVIGMLFVLFVLVAAFRARSSDMGKLALVMLAGIGAVTALVYFTGEPAEDAVEKVAGVSRAMIRDHEEAAEAAFIATGVAGVLALVALWWHRRRELPRWVVAASFAATLAVSGLMAWTANLGGQIRHSEIRATSAGDITGDQGDDGK
jgi:uncharacterized membrane protein